MVTLVVSRVVQDNREVYQPKGPNRTQAKTKPILCYGGQRQIKAFKLDLARCGEILTKSCERSLDRVRFPLDPTIFQLIG